VAKSFGMSNKGALVPKSTLTRRRQKPASSGDIIIEFNGHPIHGDE